MAKKSKKVNALPTRATKKKVREKSSKKSARKSVSQANVQSGRWRVVCDIDGLLGSHNSREDAVATKASHQVPGHRVRILGTQRMKTRRKTVRQQVRGYDPNFLGSALKLPRLSKRTLAPLLASSGHEIQYTHFSIFVNRERCLPAMAAVNIKGEAYANLTRGGTEPWDFSDQIDKSFQIDNRFYGKDDNTFDRGHLVRRIDPCWGEVEQATLAETETFRWVNCTPQHKKLNRNGGPWYQLEQHVMENGVKNKIADISVFSGPVLNPEDMVFVKKYQNKEVKIPVRFWKVITWRKTDNNLYAVGFMLDQTEWIKHKLKAPSAPIALRRPRPTLPDDYFENLEFNDNKTYQVRLQDIEKATGIAFDWNHVTLPFKSARPQAVKSKRLRNVYPFDVYIKSKIRVKQHGRMMTLDSIKKDIKKSGAQPLSQPSIRQSIKNGYGGHLKQYDLKNIKL